MNVGAPSRNWGNPTVGFTSTATCRVATHWTRKRLQADPPCAAHPQGSYRLANSSRHLMQILAESNWTQPTCYAEFAVRITLLRAMCAAIDMELGSHSIKATGWEDWDPKAAGDASRRHAGLACAILNLSWSVVGANLQPAVTSIGCTSASRSPSSISSSEMSKSGFHPTSNTTSPSIGTSDPNVPSVTCSSLLATYNSKGLGDVPGTRPPPGARKF